MKLRAKLLMIPALVAATLVLGPVPGSGQAKSAGLPISVKLARPDLVVSSILSTWTRFTVTNVGTAAAGPFTVAVGPVGESGLACLSGAFFAPMIWTAVRVDSLAIGASVSLDAEPSAYARYIAVDLNNEVVELNESNDTAHLPGDFYPCPTSDGDLGIG